MNAQGYNARDSLSWTPPDYPCSSVPDGKDCEPYCVFDVYGDPRETTDLSGNATLLKDLVDKYNALGKEPINWHDRAGSKPGGRTPDDAYTTTCAYMNGRGGFWRPWHTSTTPPPPPPPPPPHPQPSPPAPPVRPEVLDGEWTFEHVTVSIAVDAGAGTVQVKLVAPAGRAGRATLGPTTGAMACWENGTGVLNMAPGGLVTGLNITVASGQCTRHGVGRLATAPVPAPAPGLEAVGAGTTPLVLQWVCSKPDGSRCTWPDWNKPM